MAEGEKKSVKAIKVYNGQNLVGGFHHSLDRIATLEQIKQALEDLFDSNTSGKISLSDIMPAIAETLEDISIEKTLRLGHALIDALEGYEPGTFSLKWVGHDFTVKLDKGGDPGWFSNGKFLLSGNTELLNPDDVRIKVGEKEDKLVVVFSIK